MFKLFDSVAKHIHFYGLEIWGFEVSENIERVQYDVCIFFLKLPQCTFNEFSLVNMVDALNMSTIIVDVLSIGLN